MTREIRTAMQFGDQDLDALQWAVEQSERLGRPATVDSMEMHFSQPETEFTEYPTQPEKWERVEITAEEKTVSYNPTPRDMRIPFDSILGLAKSFGVSAETLSMLEEVVNRIYREIGVLK